MIYEYNETSVLHLGIGRLSMLYFFGRTNERT